MKRSFNYLLLAFALVSLVATVATAQKKNGGSMTCRDTWNSDRLQGHCEIKEQTLPAGGAIAVDGGRNGGVGVKGWDRNEILIRTRIQTAASTQAEADQLATQIRIETGGLRIHPEGPEQRDNAQWSVSFEIFVPQRSDLSLSASNGGISISDVQGKVSAAVRLSHADVLSGSSEPGHARGDASRLAHFSDRRGSGLLPGRFQGQ